MPDRKAPPGDRIKGSESNRPKSSESQSSARSIEFSEATEKALQNKVEKNNEDASTAKKTSLATLKAVYRRGAGAFSSSHRPGMTRNQWAMARVNAFLYLLNNGAPENKSYVSDNDLLPTGHPRSTRKKESMSLSPNSKDARMIYFGADTEEAISTRVSAYNAKAPKGFEVSLPTARAVFRRGALAMTASGTSRRTRNDWGFARLDAFLSLVRHGRPHNPSYTEDNDLIPLTASAARSEENAAGTVTGEESDLAGALLDIAEKYGKFNQDATGIWAGYVPAAENEVAEIGVMCANCVLYRGEDQCAIIALPVEPAGRCRFAVIPDGVVKPEPPIEDEVRALPNLISFIKEQDDYESNEDAILDMTEYSGLGYDAEPAIRAAWIRATNDDSDPFKRALSMAELTDQSIDADLLPRFEKGV